MIFFGTDRIYSIRTFLRLKYFYKQISLRVAGAISSEQNQHFLILINDETVTPHQDVFTSEKVFLTSRFILRAAYQSSLAVVSGNGFTDCNSKLKSIGATRR